jgi:AraC-like DNA-binding protein
VTPEADAVLDEALRDLRIAGSVLLRESYAPPWEIAMPDEADLRRLLAVDPGRRIVPFHLVLAGRFHLDHPALEPLTIEEGQIAICPGGGAHAMWAGARRPPMRFADLMKGARRADAGKDADGENSSGEGATTLLCGVFQLDGSPLNPLLSSLPPVLRIGGGRAKDEQLFAQASAMLAAASAAGRSGFTAARLLEILFAEAIAAYRREAGPPEHGWFAALKDRRLGRALGAFHQRPAERWSVESLAATAAMSPSRFAARFRETMGRSVMRYVAAWRMHLACRLLAGTDLALSSIAPRVGYDDAAAFSRAFSAILGTAPAAWRRAARAKRSERAGG